MFLGNAMDGDCHTVSKIFRLKDHNITIEIDCGMAPFILDVDRIAAESFFKKTVESSVVAAVTLNFYGFGSDLRAFGGDTAWAGDGEVKERDGSTGRFGKDAIGDLSLEENVVALSRVLTIEPARAGDVDDGPIEMVDAKVNFVSAIQDGGDGGVGLDIGESEL